MDVGFLCHAFLTPLFFVFGVPAHDFMEVGTGKAGVLRGMGDVALVNGQFGGDIPSVERFQNLFFRFGIGEVEIILVGDLLLPPVWNRQHSCHIGDADAIPLASMTARSITLRSSRTLPGQG